MIWLTTPLKWWYTWHRRLCSESFGPSWPCCGGLLSGVECFLGGGCEGPQAGLPRHSPVHKNEWAARKGPGSFQATAPNLTRQLNLFPFSFSFVPCCVLPPSSRNCNRKRGCKKDANLKTQCRKFYFFFFIMFSACSCHQITNMNKIDFPHHNVPFITKCTFIFPFNVYNMQMPKQCKGQIYRDNDTLSGHSQPSRVRWTN